MVKYLHCQQWRYPHCSNILILCVNLVSHSCFIPTILWDPYMFHRSCLLYIYDLWTGRSRILLKFCWKWFINVFLCILELLFRKQSRCRDNIWRFKRNSWISVDLSSLVCCPTQMDLEHFRITHSCLLGMVMDVINWKNSRVLIEYGKSRNMVHGLFYKVCQQWL